MDKRLGVVGSNQTIRDAIQKIAQRGLVDPNTGAVRNSEKVTGYVAKIHADGDFAGTIDVQEYSTSSIADPGEVKIGYHEGVYLNAMQDSSKGVVMIPKLYSEVVIMQDPVSKTEYVTLFSHVDVIRLDAYETITIGVTEREEFDESDEDSPDIPDLEETGVAAATTYSKDTITSTVQGDDEANHVTSTIDSEKMQVVVGDDKSSALLDQSSIQLIHDVAKVVLDDSVAQMEYDGTTVKLDDSAAVMECGSSSVTVENGTVSLGSTSGTDDAVLGSELADVLCSILDYLSQIMTTTMMGPQPPLNIASFISLKAQITAFKAAHSGFLTSKVQIQK